MRDTFLYFLETFHALESAVGFLKSKRRVDVCALVMFICLNLTFIQFLFIYSVCNLKLRRLFLEFIYN